MAKKKEPELKEKVEPPAEDTPVGAEIAHGAKKARAAKSGKANSTRKMQEPSKAAQPDKKPSARPSSKAPKTQKIEPLPEAPMPSKRGGANDSNTKPRAGGKSKAARVLPTVHSPGPIGQTAEVEVSSGAQANEIEGEQIEVTLFSADFRDGSRPAPTNKDGKIRTAPVDKQNRRPVIESDPVEKIATEEELIRASNWLESGNIPGPAPEIVANPIINKIILPAPYVPDETADTVKVRLVAERTKEIRVGDVLNSTYKIRGTVGHGGMGEVFRAEHLQLNKEFAIKTLKIEGMDDVGVKRFKMEIRAIAKLNHPGIVRVHNADISEAGVPYYAMDLLDGETLTAAVRKAAGRLDLPVVYDIFIQVAEAMACAHGHGIIHRDLKPSNIMLIRDGHRLQAKVVDFGLAKVVADTNMSDQLTKSGEVFGSPYYMSPEQCMGRRVDKATDIYSFGCTLFEALTGTPPFIGETALQTFTMHQSETPPTLRQASLGGGIPKKPGVYYCQASAKGSSRTLSEYGRSRRRPSKYQSW